MLLRSAASAVPGGRVRTGGSGRASSLVVALAQDPAGQRTQAQRPRVEARLVARPVALLVEPQARRDLALLLGLDGLDRQIVRVEGTLGDLDDDRGPGVGGSAVQLRQRDVL